MVNNYLEIMKNMKQAYVEIKKKSELKDLVENIREIEDGLSTNMRNS